ncbi:type I polyketide synthase [Streptomyces pinistramenti]|uniref:type I polyketide synthase n=1 Tax=Streptomyces pinistramenti TaxID=2884812 RepID=UPI001D06E215|nr:beta-ketoacyl synthase N-terminal-like domain-containing protein [Streptomyces pinistramenti]MCB5906963.1 phosphopantetheine-binding protein [Streptomyces pinistramenti]
MTAEHGNENPHPYDDGLAYGDEDNDTHLAIVGMACRFPGAVTPEEFWDNVVSGTDGVRTLTPAELREWGDDPERLTDPRYVRRHGVVDNIGDFDPAFFGVSERDADLLNPQHRIFLECAWEALERAGYDPRAVPGTTGLYAGAGRNGYSAVIRNRTDRFPGVDDLALSLANDPEHLCTRVSYTLGLTGPSVAVMTACSTSLVAVHEAGRALLAGECDTALAGGVTLRAPLSGYWHREGGTMSPDGYCRTFSQDARGIVAGDGAGVVVLRRLQDAIDDGDHVHAVIRGSAVNNDGHDRAGYTAPGVRGQSEVIRRAHLAAGVAPDDISYIEAHGTGTPVGDPIEVTALTEAFGGAAHGGAGTVALGSVKTNIGHTDTAAGIAGLIKTVLALEDGTLPATLHFTGPNPRIDFAATPFQVVTQARKWETGRLPRRAGVSSFGIGGTNAHVVLEEAPLPAPAAAPPAPAEQLLVLSARTPTALDAMAERLSQHLSRHPELPLDAVARTLQTGRHAFAHRRYLVCSDRAQALAALAAPAAAQHTDEHPVTFAFPARGARHTAALRPLYATVPAFRTSVDACCQALPAAVARDVRRLLGPDGAGQPGAEPDAGTSPAAWATDVTAAYALARTLMEWGVAPATVTGHGPGALAAASVAGALPLADALALATAAPRGADALRDAVGAAAWRTPDVPWTNAATGAPVTAREAADPGFWAALLETDTHRPDGYPLPDPTGRLHLEIGTDRQDGGPLTALLDAAGRAWQNGAAVDWSRLHTGTDLRRVPLPTYPFERQHHLVRPEPRPAADTAPAPSVPATADAAPQVPDTAEATLLGLFQQVLGTAEDVTDPDFFEHGGDSLAAVELVALIEDRFTVAMSLEDVFEHPTVSGLARVVEDLRAAANAAPETGHHHDARGES